MRARNIKPGFFKNEELAGCSPWARILFAGLWCLADREGRLEDRPKLIKAEIFPHDAVDCHALAQELENAKLIVRYEVDGQKLILVTKFKDHQNPHKKEVLSRLPAFSGTSPVITGPDRTQAVTSQVKARTDPADSLILIPDSLSLDSERRAKIPGGPYNPELKEPAGDVSEHYQEATGHAHSPNGLMAIRRLLADGWSVGELKTCASNYAKWHEKTDKNYFDSANKFYGEEMFKAYLDGVPAYRPPKGKNCKPAESPADQAERIAKETAEQNQRAAEKDAERKRILDAEKSK